MIKQELVWKTNFCDLFKFAEKHYGVSWNDANDLFFNRLFDYKGYHFVMIEECPDEFDECQDDYDKSAWICREFFRASNIPDFTEVLMDCG